MKDAFKGLQGVDLSKTKGNATGTLAERARWQAFMSGAGMGRH